MTRRGIPLLILTSALTLCGFGQAVPKPVLVPIRAPVSVPIEVIENLVFLHGRVFGSGPLDAVLDTGASLSIVTPGVGQKLNLHTDGSTQAAGLGHGKSEAMQLVEGASLRVDGGASPVEVTGQQIAILPIDYIANQTGHAGDAIFGSNLFKNFCTQVDYELQQVVFAGQGCSKGASGTQVPIKIYGDVPFVEASLAGADGSRITGLFFLDSGTTGAMLLSQHFLADHPELVAPGKSIDVLPVNAVGGAIDLKVLRVAGLDLGPFHFADLVAAVPQGSAGALANPAIAGIIGAGILERFTVTWDYALERMVLAPNARFHDPFEADGSGLRLETTAADLRIIRLTAVQAGSPAAEAGLQAGDLLIALDGKRHLRLWEVLDALRKPGNPAVLTVRRDEKEFQVTLRLRRMI